MLLPENQSMNLDMARLADNQESNDLVPANISNILDTSADDKVALCKILGGILPTQQQQQQQQQPRSMSNMMSYSNQHLQQHTPPLSQQQLEWKKVPNQFSDERKMKNSGPSPSPGSVSEKNNFQNVANSRMQGPPPPYHQATRSASVPIALQSPNPMSPVNPTSNISLPSPRPSSAVSSPSTVNKPSQQQQQHKSPNNSQDSPSKLLSQSNPTTPISSHLSPSNSNTILEFTTGSTTTTSNSNFLNFNFNFLMRLI